MKKMVEFVSSLSLSHHKVRFACKKVCTGMLWFAQCLKLFFECCIFHTQAVENCHTHTRKEKIVNDFEIV